MIVLSSVLGIFFMLIGFCYLYCPGKVSDFNNWMKENIFNDRLLLTHRRKTGTLLILIGAVIIYFVIKLS